MVSGRYTLIVLAVLLLSSCSSHEFDSAVKAVNDVFGAREIKASAEEIVIEEPTKQESGSELIVLSIRDPKLVSANYSDDKILSTAALTFALNLPAEAPSNQLPVRVDLERNGQKSSRSFTMKSLHRAHDLIETTSEFFNWNPADGIGWLRETCDREFVSDSVLMAFAANYSALIDSGGNVMQHRIGGFRFEKAQIPGDEVLIVWAESQREKLTIPFTFYYSADSGKMLLVATEDMK